MRDFGADPAGVADSTAAIQAAVDHAQSRVVPAVDKVGDPVGGCDVVFDGVFRVSDIHIKRVQGYQTFIGFLVSGTRNATVPNCFVERGWCGIYLEDTSELYGSQNSCIGCTYGIVLDARYNRAAVDSVLDVACTGNDVSSTTFDQTTVYYPQHTGILAVNAG